MSRSERRWPWPVVLLVVTLGGCNHWIGVRRGELVRQEVERVPIGRTLEATVSVSDRGGVELAAWEVVEFEETIVSVYARVERWVRYSMLLDVLFDPMRLLFWGEYRGKLLPIGEFPLIPLKVLTLFTFPSHTDTWSFDNALHNLVYTFAAVLPGLNSCMNAEDMGSEGQQVRADRQFTDPYLIEEIDATTGLRERGETDRLRRRIPVILTPLEVVLPGGQVLSRSTDAFGRVHLDLPAPALRGAHVRLRLEEAHVDGLVAVGE